MNNNQKQEIENLASAYFNPFQMRYEVKKSEDVLRELLPLLAIPGSLQVFEGKLEAIAKKHYEETRKEFAEEFLRLFDKSPSDFSMNAKAYEEGIRDLAMACVKHYAASPNKMEDADRQNWKTITENISNPLFEKHFFIELKAARKSDILFKSSLSKASRQIEREELMSHYQSKHNDFVKAGAGQQKVEAKQPAKKSFMDRFDEVFGLR